MSLVVFIYLWRPPIRQHNHIQYLV